jgi:hypothetical protein
MSNRSKARSRACVIAVTITLLAVLTGCALVSSAPKVSPAAFLYQPRVLRLAAGQTVPTQDGQYTPTAPEVWHSDRSYRELEAQLIDTAAALSQLQNRKAAQ